ncbi:SGNH/GDSL hydrolase family protein [Burkholderia theae]|uniref:SGNH/GDSL hydrolase family protein n=1 Tax=Burkholderia theae TaxID=3143496 RepID=UPI003AFB5046
MSGRFSGIAARLASANYGANIVAYTQPQAGAVPSTLQQKALLSKSLNEFDNVQDAINATDLEGELYIPAGFNVLAAAYDNRYGAKLKGPGALMLADGLSTSPVSVRKQNLSWQDTQIVSNRQLASNVIANVRAGAGNKIILSGPSTVAGDGLVDTTFKLDQLLTVAALDRGIQFQTIINAGHGGAKIDDWLVPSTGYLDQDMAQGPTGYLMAWGANDPGAMQAADAKAFIDKYYQGLSRIRASYPVGTLALYLCVPMTMGDTPSGRCEYWCEMIAPGIRALAEHFDCVLIDLYTFAQQARSAATHWMADDIVAGSGRVIHPNENLNAHYAQLLADVIWPMAGLTGQRTNRVFNLSSAQGGGTLYSATAMPSQMLMGIGMYRTDASWTFGPHTYNGAVYTFKQADTVTWQLVADYGANPWMMIRAAVTGTNAWGAPVPLVNQAANLTVASGWSGTPSVCNKQCRCAIRGTQSQPAGAVASGATVATLPAGYAPAAPVPIVIAYSGGSSGDGTAPGRINANGTIVILAAVAGAANLQYVGTWDLD